MPMSQEETGAEESEVDGVSRLRLCWREETGGTFSWKRTLSGWRTWRAAFENMLED